MNDSSVNLLNVRGRIAIIGNYDKYGAIERDLADLIIYWVNKRGLCVDMLLYREGECFYPEEISSLVNVFNLKTTHKITTLLSLSRYLYHVKPDVLLSNKLNPNRFTSCSKALPGLSTRSFLCFHNTYSKLPGIASQKPFKKFLKKLSLRISCLLADGIIAVSQGVADDLVQEFGVPSNKINVIYNPVITPDIYKKSYEKADHPWFCSHDVPVILGVGRLSYEKDFPTLIRAFASVRQHLNCKLVILGEGNERERLYKLIEELGIQKDVDLPGFVSNPYPFMAQSDVFVLSSLWEGLPTVVIEALALNTPVISTDCPSGPREILKDGKLGSLVPMGDPEKMCRTICDFLYDKIEYSYPRSALLPYTVEFSSEKYLNVIGLKNYK